MMRVWTVILPHFIFAWFARQQCAPADTQLGRLVNPRPGVFLSVPKKDSR